MKDLIGALHRQGPDVLTITAKKSWNLKYWMDISIRSSAALFKLFTGH